MWQTLIAEFKYNKGVVIPAYLVAVFMLLWDLDGVYGLSAACAIIYFVCIPIMTIRMDKEKRDRLYLRLPLALKEASATRLLFIILFQGGLFFLWSIVFFTDHFGHDNQAIWTMITTSAFVIMVITFFAIYHDLGHFNTPMYRIIYFTILILFFVGLIGSIMNGYMPPEAISFGNKHQKIFWDTIIYGLLCSGMVYFNYHLFMWRKSYLS